MFGGDSVGVVVYLNLGCGGGYCGGGCDGFHLLVWRISCWVCCARACVVGFGCGSVMIGVTPIFGCVWLTM